MRHHKKMERTEGGKEVPGSTNERIKSGIGRKQAIVSLDQKNPESGPICRRAQVKETQNKHRWSLREIRRKVLKKRRMGAKCDAGRCNLWKNRFGKNSKEKVSRARSCKLTKNAARKD